MIQLLKPFNSMFYSFLIKKIFKNQFYGSLMSRLSCSLKNKIFFLTKCCESPDLCNHLTHRLNEKCFCVKKGIKHF